MGKRATAKGCGSTLYIPTHRDEAAMDGVPDRWWLMRENKQQQRQKQILRFARG